MRSDNHMTPLHLATLEGHIEVMKLLLEHGVQKDKATANDTGHPVAACFQMFSYKPLFEVNSEKNFECELVFFPSLWTPQKKKTESHAGSVGFLHVLFFHLFFYFVFFIAKIPRFISKQKNQSCEKNLGQVHSGLFLCTVFFCFCSGFLLSQAQLSKISRKTKKKQKKQSCEKNLG